MPEKIYNKVVVVDENDSEIGAEYMMDAINKGLIRRASRVFVFNKNGQILVQRRSEYVLKPLLLDQSAAGHVDEGETYYEAAVRELNEELGIKNVDLEEIVVSLRTTDFYNAVYRVIIENDEQINFDTEEVAEVIWFDVKDLDKEMLHKPENFNKSFIQMWGSLRDRLMMAV
ncbi:NUDIX domain-containing protein [Candidatus Kaiserbacteria bacterium]|nr:NUDIX domain-containing protein [Candidatus Kaiserbacteria bacterium]